MKKENDNVTQSAVLPGGAPLLARVRAEAARPGLSRMRWALGYLFLPGLAPLAHALTSGALAGEVHLLIGNTAGQPTDEQVVAGAGRDPTSPLAPRHDVAAQARAERARIVTETAGALRANLAQVSRTDENARLLSGLAAAITTNRVRVRIYAGGRLHAKAYLFEHENSAETIALVGSSNVSLPSLGNVTELNVVVGDPAGAGAVAAWFDALWNNAQDFSRDLVAELSQAWPLLQPAD